MDNLWKLIDAIGAAPPGGLDADPEVVEEAEALVADEELSSGFVPYEFTGCTASEKRFLNALLNKTGDFFAACKAAGINPIEVHSKLKDPNCSFSDWYYRVGDTLNELSLVVARREALVGAKEVVVSKGSVTIKHKRDPALLKMLLAAEHPQYAETPTGKRPVLVGSVAPTLNLPAE